MSLSARYSARDLAELLGTHPPTPEQTAVIEAPLSPVVVVAGAGSGKTETMAARVVWLVANGFVQPQDVLGLTFTRKAALELATRLADKLAMLRRAGVGDHAAGAGSEQGSGVERGSEHGSEQGSEQRPPSGRSPGSPAAGGPTVPVETVPDAFDLPTISTYHAYAGRLVSEHGLRLGVEPDARLLSEAASWQLAHQVVGAYAGDMSLMDRAESTVVRAVLGLSAELGEHLVPTQEAEDWVRRVEARLRALPGRDGSRPTAPGRNTADALAVQALVYPLVEEYRRAKAAEGALDFGDQMALAARLAREVPEVGVGERVRFRAVLLDEFQDTSEAQMVLLRSLFGGADLPVTAVGDPHQSIYGWRGASASTLTRFPQEFAVSGVEADVLHLSTSWRNDVAVLAAANAVADPLREATPIPVRTLDARDGAGSGSVEAARLGDHVAEAAHVATWVREHWGRPGARTAAVLCRARAQFPTVVDALRSLGLPVEVVGLGGLLDTPEVLDLVALLWVAQEPTRGDQVMRLLAGPVCRLGAADIDLLWSWARHQARAERRDAHGADGPVVHSGREHAAVLAEAVDSPPPGTWADPTGRRLSPAAVSRVGWLGGVLRRVRTLVGLPLPDLLTEAERLLGLDLEVAADPELHPAWGRAQLDALGEVAAGFAAGADRATLGGFLSWLDAAREHERGLEGVEVPELAEIQVDSSAVQVLTVHAAKGLEWDIVAVPGLVEGTFPAGTARATHDGSGWTVGPRRDRGWLSGIGHLPTPLRGDREGRPTLGWLSVADTHELASDLDRLALEGGAYAIQEERRLAYVALTRARHRMLLTAPVWSTGRSPRVTSRFLLDVLAEPQAGVTLREWAPMPDPDDPVENVNPRSLEESLAPWPVDGGRRRTAVRDLVAAMSSARAMGRAESGCGPDRTRDRDELWTLATMLLAERDEARRSPPTSVVPAHLSTTAVVRLASDPDGFLAAQRRPMPTPPAVHARMGTSFHAWVEQHFSAPALVDLDDWAAGDDEHRPEDDLEVLRSNFLASEWAARSPVAVEVAVETVIAGRTVRGRIDAVFEDDDGGVTIVDWKTGRTGEPGRERLRALQLAVYRVAYSRLTGRHEDAVRGAFFFAGDGRTVRPDLPGAEALEELLGALGPTPEDGPA